MNSSTASRSKPQRRTGWSLAGLLGIATAAGLTAGWMPGAAQAQDATLQQAVNYVFTGRVDPPDAPEIADATACMVVVPDPRNKRYARYYLRRFNTDSAWFSKRYSGRDVMYTLEVDGADTIVEYLTSDKKRVSFGFKSTRIPIAGDVDQTQKALERIAVLCPNERPKTPF